MVPSCAAWTAKAFRQELTRRTFVRILDALNRRLAQVHSGPEAFGASCRGEHGHAVGGEATQDRRRERRVRQQHGPGHELVAGTGGPELIGPDRVAGQPDTRAGFRFGAVQYAEEQGVANNFPGAGSRLKQLGQGAATAELPMVFQAEKLALVRGGDGVP